MTIYVAVVVCRKADAPENNVYVRHTGEDGQSADHVRITALQQAKLQGHQPLVVVYDREEGGKAVRTWPEEESLTLEEFRDQYGEEAYEEATRDY